MAAKALQLRHRGECGLEPLQCVKRSQPAEIARGDDREEIQPQIGRRGAVGDDRFGIFLKIVGRQHVVFRRDECFEEAPGAPRDQPQRQGVRRRDRQMTGREAAACLPSARRAATAPTRTQTAPRSASFATRRHKTERRQRRRSPALAAICSARLRVSNREFVCRLCGRHPFEQVAPANEDAEQRAHHRIDHDPGLMREEGDEERALQQAEGEIAAQRAQMIAQRNARAVRHDAVDRRQQRRQRDGQQEYRRSRSRPPRIGSSQPISMARSAAGAESERRRLSSSFHRPINGSGVFGEPSLALSRKPKIQGSNCQSPRTQRCWRAAATA